MNCFSAPGLRAGELCPTGAPLPATAVSCRIIAGGDSIGRDQFGTLDSPPIRRRGRRGGVGRPTPPSFRLSALSKYNPLERRSSPALNGSGPRPSPQPKARIPGGVGQPTPPPAQFKSGDLARFDCSQRGLARASREGVDDVVTDASSVARGRRRAVGASLIAHDRRLPRALASQRS